MAYTTKELQKAMDVLNKSSNNDYCLECQSCIDNGYFVSAEESKCADRKESNI